MAVFFFVRSTVAFTSLFSMRATTQTLFATGGVSTFMLAYFSSIEYQAYVTLVAFLINAEFAARGAKKNIQIVFCSIFECWYYMFNQLAIVLLLGAADAKTLNW